MKQGLFIIFALALIGGIVYFMYFRKKKNCNCQKCQQCQQQAAPNTPLENLVQQNTQVLRNNKPTPDGDNTFLTFTTK